MGVDWYWIKQRPQIIAEMLSYDFDVTVAYYKEVILRLDLRKDNDELEKSIPIPVIPYREKNKLIHLVQQCIFKYKVRNIEQYDAIWIAHPLLYGYIPKSYQGRIIYDCMDNHKALCNDFKIKRAIDKVEADLIRCADLVMASSNRLKCKIEKKYQIQTRLVRNGFVAGQIHFTDSLSKKNRKIKIGYFGTIAEWIDFDALIKCLDEIMEINFFFWGPVLLHKVPRHDRLFYKGVVEHDRLWENAKKMDCLIMPFIVNNSIKDVDPVKLYEYISMGKIIIAPFYNEIKRFEPYVYFYRNEDELLNLLKRLRERELKCKYTKFQQANFLEHNTWDKRYEIIKKNLLEIL